ncbi:MAG: hypothetical protein KJO54_01670 [Gammaproteobacteria bacterium]|nr:hypothetical protein [Gammaproteobacteria bacterium]NNF60800.1 hypothetical protein [Gammaproteobacteria bacterium]NNM21735.1 hypothetical protein [Gammaproteobacteria bacterium]
MYRFLIILLLAAGLSGCLARLTGDHYGRHEARVPQQVTYGTIEELRLVSIEGTKSRIGPLIGAIIGGTAFEEVGDGRGRKVMKVVGASVGGVAGAAVEEGVTRRKGVEITVTLRDGDTIAVVQEIDPKTDFRVGDSVRVLFLDGYARITPRST